MGASSVAAAAQGRPGIRSEDLPGAVVNLALAHLGPAVHDTRVSFLVRYLSGHLPELAQVPLLPQDLEFRDHLPGLLQLVGGGAQPALHYLPAHVQPGLQGVQHPLGLGGEGRSGGLDQLDLLGQQVHLQARARAVAFLRLVGRLGAL